MDKHFEVEEQFRDSYLPVQAAQIENPILEDAGLRDGRSRDR